MQPLFAYLLKLSFCLAASYLFYYFFLRRMTYYTWNRYFLLLFTLLALVIPLLPMHLPGDIQTFNAVFFITGALPSAPSATSSLTVSQQGSQWTLPELVLLTMITGMVFFLLKFVARFYSLRKTRNVAKLVNNGEVQLYHLPGVSAPFSFHNSIYLDTERYDDTELQKIITHELVHVTQKHTADMLLTEVLCIIQWFNPFAWLLRQAIRQNLEFIADDEVLQKGINRKGYQYLLLKVSGGVPYTLANNLLFPSLKKRIQMMNRTRTSRIHLLKFICAIPLVCLLLLGFSRPAGDPAKGPSIVPDAFQLSSLSFYINDAGVAAIVQKEQGKSFLKPGGALSLALISEEKARLTNLLKMNGYDQISNHAITFVMDTSAASHSFSVQVTIQLGQTKKEQQAVTTIRTAKDNTAIKRTSTLNNQKDETAADRFAEHLLQPLPGAPVADRSVTQP